MYNKYISSLEGSASVELMLKAEQMRKNGKEVISLAGGEPDFDTPQRIVSKAIQALNQGETHYAVGQGIVSLRKHIAEKLRQENAIMCNAEEIIVTPGGKYGIYLAIASLMNAGEEAIVFTPSWVSYCPIIRACGGNPVISPLQYDDNYKIKEENIVPYITEKTKVIIINYPNNPTGRVLSIEEAELLRNIVKKYNLYIISDEIYEKIVYDGKRNVSLASYCDISDRVITINGFSKCAAMTGWRIGYTVACTDITKIMYKLYVHTITGLSPFIQKAAIEVFYCKDEIEQMRKTYEYRRDYFVDELNKIDGVECKKPEGAFYAWVRFKNEQNSKKVCEDLLEKYGIIGVNGQAYGEEVYPCVRFSFASDMEILKRVIKKMRDI